VLYDRGEMGEIEQFIKTNQPTNLKASKQAQVSLFERKQNTRG